MDSTHTTGDPWDLPEEETAPEAAPTAAGGLSPFAESTGLFNRSTVVAEPTTAPGATPEPVVEAEADVVADGAVDESPSVPVAADVPAEPVGTPDEQVDEFLQELEAVTQTALDEPAEADSSFELIPPPPPETPFEGHASSDETDPEASDEFRTALAESHPYEAPEAAGSDSPEVDIEFGAPNTPEGSEEPTGKAVRAATEGVISRAMLLTTNTIEGANIAPVDMVVAVEMAGDSSEISSAMDRALDQLRAASQRAGAEAVVAVSTDVVTVNGSIVVTASGTAVNLL